MTAPSSSGVAEGDLRLVALALIAETPRHGYEIIQLIEEKTADWYLPSPNVVHPMLANLAEAGYLTASADPPRLYTITDDGRAYLRAEPRSRRCRPQPPDCARRTRQPLAAGPWNGR